VVHLLLEFVSFFAGTLGEVFTIGGIDDAARGVDDKTTILGHSVTGDLFEAATLGTYARNEEEGVGDYLTYITEHLGLGCSDDIHHIVEVAPLLGGLEDTLEETFAGGAVFHKLEVESTLIGSEGEEDDPLAVVGGEGDDGILSHIRGDGESVEVEVAVGREEGFGVLLGGVANVSTFGVSDKEGFFIERVEVADGELELTEAFDAHGLVEGEVGFVCYGVVDGGIDDGFVELEDAVGLGGEVTGHLVEVGIEADTEEGTALTDEVNQFGTGHV
jgi:hypothetical protein